MHIELHINENRVEFFLEYLNSLKDGIIEKIEIKQKPSFMLSSVDEVKKRVELAEKMLTIQSMMYFGKRWV